MDSVEIDQRSNHGTPKYKSRKRREEEECANGGASPSYINEDDNNNKNRINISNEGDGKRLKIESANESHEVVAKGDGKGGGKRKSGKATEQAGVKSAEPPKLDYIHVRARRGQATDSHSLAERARREKISERMKILQDLVPGCNKVIGKALVLDEIINYIQALQHQVEFLSMKLEAVNTRVGVDGSYPPKDFTPQNLDNPAVAFDSQGTREYGRGSPSEWLHMQIGSSFETTSS